MNQDSKYIAVMPAAFTPTCQAQCKMHFNHFAHCIFYPIGRKSSGMLHTADQVVGSVDEAMVTPPLVLHVGDFDVIDTLSGPCAGYHLLSRKGHGHGSLLWDVYSIS